MVVTSEALGHVPDRSDPFSNLIGFTRYGAYRFTVKCRYRPMSMTSFHAAKCCHLVGEHDASAGAYAAASASS